MLLFDSAFGMLFYVMSTLVPTIVAGIVLMRYKYISNKKHLLKVIFNFKSSPKQYCLVLLFLLLQYIFLILLTPLRDGANIFVALAMIVPCIFDGGLEELGWRYLLGTTLESKMNYILATICTAVIWFFWHTLHFFIKGTGQYNMSFVLYFILVLGISFALSALYRITQNIWLCTLCHATINAFSFCYEIATNLVATTLTTVVLIAVSIALVEHHNRKRISNTNEFKYNEE